MDRRAKSRLVNIVGFCGGGAFFLLNIATKGAVPGGFVGGVLGYLLFGGLAALVVYVLMPDEDAVSNALPERGTANAVALDVHDLPALFDRRRFGWNLLVGVGYLVGQLLIQFTWMIPTLLRGGDVGWNPARYYLATLVVGGLEAAAFVLAVHGVRSARALPIVWGLGAVAFHALFRALAIPDMPAGLALAPLSLFSGFVYGFLFMLGLVLAVRLWAVRLWSMMTGAAAGLFVHAVVFQIVWATTRPDYRLSWEHPAVAILDGVIVGGLVYVGVALHLRRLARKSSHGDAADTAPQRPTARPSRTGPLTKAVWVTLSTLVAVGVAAFAVSRGECRRVTLDQSGDGITFKGRASFELNPATGGMEMVPLTRESGTDIVIAGDVTLDGVEYRRGDRLTAEAGALRRQMWHETLLNDLRCRGE